MVHFNKNIFKKVEPVISNDESEEPTPPKRGRGRPPRQKVVQIDEKPSKELPVFKKINWPF